MTAVADRAIKWTRWTARGIGTLTGLFCLLIGIAEVVWPHTLPSPEASQEGAMLAGLVITAVLGVLIAWWREGIGGTVVVIGAIGLAIFAYVTAGHNKVWAMLITGGPFFLAGILFLASWWLSRRPRTSSAAG